MKDVIAYCKVACAKESDPSAEGQRQEQMVRRYADARGLIICATYLDAGVSGGTLERLRGQHSEQGGHFAWPQRGKVGHEET